LKNIQLTITSTIHYPEQEEPEMIQQQLSAGLLQVGEEWQISYMEGSDREQSRVRLFAFDDELIVIRQGPISYQQVYQPAGVTTCEMTTPSGKMEIEVITHQYQREEGKIYCYFTLRQTDVNLGDFQLEITW
jgi:uncharacterized beta-barrel protein YwiB (DUF1934 family)